MRDAPRLLAALFDDGGAALLAGLGAPPSWAAALGPVPVQVLAVSPGPDAGIRQLAGIRDWLGQRDPRAAVAIGRAVVDHRVRVDGPEHPDTLLELGALGTWLHRAGASAEGSAVLDRAWTAIRSVAGGRDLRVAVVAQNVAAARLRDGRLADAGHALDVAHRIRRELAPATTGLVAAQLGEVQLQLGRTAEAVPLLREAFDRTAASDGPRAPRTIARGQMLGTVLNQLERYAEAAKVLRSVVDGVDAADPDRRAAVAFELGLASYRSGAREEGIRRVEEAVRWTRAVGTVAGPHPSLANRVTMLAQIHVERGRSEEAEGLLKEATEADRRTFGDASPEVAGRYAELGRMLARVGRADEALGSRATTIRGPGRRSSPPRIWCTTRRRRRWIGGIRRSPPPWSTAGSPSPPRPSGATTPTSASSASCGTGSVADGASP
ncbi:MAG: tetratricopeptide repeat protein [Myxococcota bacterium]